VFTEPLAGIALIKSVTIFKLKQFEVFEQNTHTDLGKIDWKIFPEL
jgi:hypothetical protein